jgi:hypothetical protein
LLGEPALRLVLDVADLSDCEALVKHGDLDHQIKALLGQVCPSVATLWLSPPGAPGDQDSAATEYAQHYSQAEYR